MKQTWLPHGSSDPISYTCTCPASKAEGLVLLFYRYFSAPPSLPAKYLPEANDPIDQATFQTSLTQSLDLSGKIRVSKEGFNITIAGTKTSIQTYIRTCITHWSFANLELSSPEKIDAFFKPTTGCRCVFGGGDVVVKVAEEITPMGVTGYLPKNWNAIESLEPEEFHDRCWEDREGKGEMALVDVRNFYESRIGYFVDPRTGKEAVRPAVRRFSQWPMYVKRVMGSDAALDDGQEQEQKSEGRNGGRQIMTYCTGGIRCEKGARFMEENMKKRDGDKVCTLKGGIAAYLTWMDEEIRLGKKSPQDSLFKGKNYVFDARGSTSLTRDSNQDPVSNCHICGKPEDRLSKCRSKGCHLILVVCEACETKDPRCCESCKLEDVAISSALGSSKQQSRPICDCEREREVQLWGSMRPKEKKQQKRRPKGREDIDIQVKIIA